MFWIMYRKKNYIFQYYTIKPIFYGSIISKILKLKKFFIFSGLGNFIGNDKGTLNLIINKILKLFLPSKNHFFFFRIKMIFIN